MMRRKDWADDEAESLFEFVRDGLTDDEVIAEIAKSLRTAARDFHNDPITGPVDGEEPSRG